MKPDPYADESVADLDPVTHSLYLEAVENAKSWAIEANRLKAELYSQLGDADAGLIDGRKLITHRPIGAYAEARLIKDNPDLTAIYFEIQAEQRFNFERFKRNHPEVAEKYRTRQFRSLADVVTE